jgi:hypothetical protein
LLHLPEGKQAEKVDAAIRRAMAKLPSQFFCTITWDQGEEMARPPRRPAPHVRLAQRRPPCRALPKRGSRRYPAGGSGRGGHALVGPPRDPWHTGTNAGPCADTERALGAHEEEPAIA